MFTVYAGIIVVYKIFPKFYCSWKGDLQKTLNITENAKQSIL